MTERVASSLELEQPSASTRAITATTKCFATPRKIGCGASWRKPTQRVRVVRCTFGYSSRAAHALRSKACMIFHRARRCGCQRGSFLLLTRDAILLSAAASSATTGYALTSTNVVNSSPTTMRFLRRRSCSESSGATTSSWCGRRVGADVDKLDLSTESAGTFADRAGADGARHQIDAAPFEFKGA